MCGCVDTHVMHTPEDIRADVTGAGMHLNSMTFTADTRNGLDGLNSKFLMFLFVRRLSQEALFLRILRLVLDHFFQQKHCP